MTIDQYIQYLLSFTSPERVMALAALITAAYAAFGGSRRDKTKRATTVAEMEADLRAAIYEDLEKQRRENIVLRRQIAMLRRRVADLTLELHSQPGYIKPQN